MNMKKFFRLAAMVLPLLFIGCGGSDDEEETSAGGPSSGLVGKKYEGSGRYEQSYTYTYGDYEFQKINNAIYFVPQDKYTASWTYKDTLLTTYELTTKQLALSFESGTKAALTDYTKSEVVQQKAEVYHHYYRFKDYYIENGLYMVNITANSFSVYDKTKSRRYDFRLDGNYGCSLSFYIKKGGTQQDESDHTYIYSFSYAYDEGLSHFVFSDKDGHTAYGYVATRYSQDSEENGFSLHLDGKTYFMKEK